MKNTKKDNNLKNTLLIIFLTIIMGLARYVLFPNENQIASTPENETIQTSTIVASSPENQTSTTVATNSNTGITDIPEYSGQIVISINNDVPYFEEKDLTTADFEDYAPLDELDRGGQAFANICKYTMPPEGTKRGSISYKPSGWNQFLYGDNNSQHLYERCHLIAWQLGNENNNKRNLITGTSQMNAAMIEYENSIANWIKQKNKEGKNYHVLYRVTPIYNGENKVATGVELEAKSVEEEGISFNKFIYNVQDNFKINYSTGEAKLIK